MRRATTAPLGATAVALLLTACTSGSGAMTDSSPTSAPTSAPTDGPTTSGESFPEDTPLQLAENSGEWDLVLTDVRVRDHDGFDRIVLEFTGTGVPGWSVGWVDTARLDGSGEAVALGGDAVLDIYASGTTWPADGSYDGPQQFEPADGGDVDDVYVGGTFEGYTQVLAGIDDTRSPFRVFALTDPPRLVVDVTGTAS